jgi:hypothetical protein
LRPAAFFWAVVPPCFELPPEPDFVPPWLDASGELAIRAALAFDIPFSLSASYCFSFFTLGRLSGMTSSLSTFDLRMPLALRVQTVQCGRMRVTHNRGREGDADGRERDEPELASHPRPHTCPRGD